MIKVIAIKIPRNQLATQFVINNHTERSLAKFCETTSSSIIFITLFTVFTPLPLPFCSLHLSLSYNVKEKKKLLPKLNEIQTNE